MAGPLVDHKKEIRIAIPTLDSLHSFIHSFIPLVVASRGSHFRSVVVASLSGRWWMAKNNKYASINFNHIYEKPTSTNTANTHKNPSSSSYSSASYSAVSAPNKPHGRILVLTRPTPKPITPPTPQPQPSPNPIQNNSPRSEPGSDAISLRPLGRTGTGSSLSPLPVPNHDKDLPSPQPPKTNKFVPPHLRPGFVPREDAPGPEPSRPKSGGGPDRMRRPAGSDLGILGRGSRPNSSGWYVNVLYSLFSI
ncbi:hypothetical protein CR513_17083, partial [Mucuna pruriens]